MNIYQINIQYKSTFILHYMSKPDSIKVEPWVDFPRQPYSLAHDDFLHEKLAILKINAKGQTSTVNAKASLSKAKEYEVSDEVKLWFSLPENRWLYSKIKSNGYLKVHFDNGLFEKWGRQWNLYGGFNANKSFENISVKLGATHRSPSYQSDNRLKIEFLPDSKGNLTWYNRTMIHQNNFTYGILGAYSITQNHILKNSLFLGYKRDNGASMYFRLQNEGFRKTPVKWSNYKYFFDNIIFDYVRNIEDKNMKIAIESDFSFREISNDLSGTIQHYNPTYKITSKVKLNCSLDLFCLVKFPSFVFGQIATTSLGFRATTLYSNKRSIKFGGQLEFNV